jgi:hypothetical protein
MGAFSPASEDNYIRFVAIGGAFMITAWLLSVRLLRHPLWLNTGHPPSTSQSTALRDTTAG